MRVKVEVEEIELDGDYNNTIEGIIVTCLRCNHAVEIYGTSESSVRRGCVTLREECPQGERNYYVHEDYQD